MSELRVAVVLYERAKATPDVVRRAVELGRPHGAIPELWEPPA